MYYISHTFPQVMSVRMHILACRRKRSLNSPALAPRMKKSEPGRKWDEPDWADRRFRLQRGTLERTAFVADIMDLNPPLRDPTRSSTRDALQPSEIVMRLRI